ncbi:serine-rich adhesin for platelets [Penaeus vannamei]|uniref:serine-rich adhesin for platelets n=1 Tax=Penaeus vannamei TaxID=6689 RepID=UPI00387F8D70
MAPIQKHFSSHVEENSSSASSKAFTTSSSFHTVKTSSSHNSAIASENKTATNSDQPQTHISLLENQADREVMLPITSRGHFHHDSFFENLRQQFDTAVRDMLDLWDSRSSFEDDLLSYRRMRDLNLTEETQALSVSQDNTSHQVVIDVRDFMDGDIKVKVVDDSELVIEGSVEKRQDGAVSKKTFCRRFSFPGLLSEDAVSSSMSADGVLTVTVPKKTSLTNKEGQTIKITASHKKSADATKTHTNTTNNVETKEVSVEGKTSKSSGVKVQEDQTQSTESQNTQDSSDSTQANPLASFHLLPISERGPFFRDSFFQDTRRQFQEAVDQVLKEWGQVDSASDHMNMYRNLRKQNLQEENQAVAFSEDHQCYKIVADVQDFKEGDVKVKVVDENELTIEGNLEIKRDDSVSSKSFFRRFCFPGLVSADTVTSGMSSDGILTVTVPKTSGSKASAVSEASTSQVSQTSSQNTEGKQTLTKVSKSEHQSFRSEYQNASTRRTEATSSLANKLTSEENQEGANSRICESGSSLLESTQSSKDAVDDQWLPISSKGQFFSDSFFEDVRKDFETAVNEVLSRHDIMRSANDELSCYRSLRERELKDETQAMKTTEDQHGFKVVLDVHDFMNEDVRVKVVDNKEVVVEGRAEKNDGTLRSSKSFCRRFTLPGAVDMNAVTSAMSSDGVLTITAPKIANAKGTQNNTQ